MAEEDEIDAFIKRAANFTTEQEQKYREYRGRRGNETEMWHAWNANKSPQTLAPLLESHKPLIRSQASKMMAGYGGSIPRAAVENELTIATLRQYETYDPSKGPLTAHVHQGFPRISDFTAPARNIKHMPSSLAKRYDMFHNAKAEFLDEHGREPTAAELKERLPKTWKINEIKNMQKGFGKELFTDMGDGLSLSEQHAQLEPRDAFELTRSKMTDLEQRFGELWYPPPGQPSQSIKNIAKILDVPQHKAYRLKNKVKAHVDRPLKRQ
jgi:DNA-directed RNA polymerase specialized sigma subunit